MHSRKTQSVYPKRRAKEIFTKLTDKLTKGWEIERELDNNANGAEA